MAKDKKDLLGKIIFPPLIVFGGIMALWENEARFDYAEAARETIVIAAPSNAPANTTVSMTGKLDTGIPIPGEYVDQFSGYHIVSRKAEIYAWDRDEDSDGRVDWRREWQHRLESNSRNRALRQTLTSKSLYPPEYRLDDLMVDPARIHFVDDYSGIANRELTLTDAGRNAGLNNAGKYFYKPVSASSATELGDERVSYSGIRHTPTATYFGLIHGDTATGKQFPVRDEPVLTLGQFRFNLHIQDIIRNDGILHHLVNGDREQALQTMESHLVRLVWIVRLGGTIAIVLGIYMFFSYFVNLLYRIPLIGDLIGLGVFLLSLAIGLPIALLVMLSSFLVHNPLMATLPLALIAGAIVLMNRRAKTASVRVKQTLKKYQAAHAPKTRTDAATATPADPDETTLSVLLRLAMLEDDFDIREKKFIGRWASKNGVPASRMQELFEQARQGDKVIHTTDRNDLILMTCLAMVDGTLSTRELSVLNAVGRKMGLTAPDVREIVVGVETGTLAPA